MAGGLTLPKKIVYLAASFFSNSRCCSRLSQAALQAVCEALLHSGRRNTSLLGLPSIWMEQLLRQLTGEKQEVKIGISLNFGFGRIGRGHRFCAFVSPDIGKVVA